MHRIQRAFTFKMMYRNLGTSGGATNSLNRALIRSHQTDYGVKLIVISLMNTKSGIFTRGFATRENTAFGVHSVK